MHVGLGVYIIIWTASKALRTIKLSYFVRIHNSIRFDQSIYNLGKVKA